MCTRLCIFALFIENFYLIDKQNSKFDKTVGKSVGKQEFFYIAEENINLYNPFGRQFDFHFIFKPAFYILLPWYLRFLFSIRNVFGFGVGGGRKE